MMFKKNLYFVFFKKFDFDPDPEMDPEPDTEPDPELSEKSDPEPDPEIIFSAPTHGIKVFQRNFKYSLIREGSVS